jgi:hypothetical protein
VTGPESPHPAGGLIGLALALLVRPHLWSTAAGLAVRMAPRGWWRTPPRLPLPDGHLWEFRMVTAYGDPKAPPRVSDFVTFLEWCRTTQPLLGRASGIKG